MILTTQTTPGANLYSNIRFQRLPFTGEISKVSFGTATENDVRNQQIGIDLADSLANLNDRELKFLGNSLKRAKVRGDVKICCSLPLPAATESQWAVSIQA